MRKLLVISALFMASPAFAQNTSPFDSYLAEYTVVSSTCTNVSNVCDSTSSGYVTGIKLAYSGNPQQLYLTEIGTNGLVSRPLYQMQKHALTRVEYATIGYGPNQSSEWEHFTEETDSSGRVTLLEDEAVYFQINNGAVIYTSDYQSGSFFSRKQFVLKKNRDKQE